MTIVDMMGVPDGDIPSSVVCNVLGLPCTTEGKLAVKSEVMSSQENRKSEKVGLGMTNDYLKEAEIILMVQMRCLLMERTVGRSAANATRQRKLSN